MKKPAGWAGFFDLYLYFTGLGEIVGQKRTGGREWGAGSLCEFRSVPPTLRFPQDGAPPFVADSREIKSGPPAVTPDGDPLLTRDIGTDEIYDISLRWH